MRGRLGRRHRDAELAEEIEAHLDALTEQHRARGLSLPHARAAARRDFGGIDQMKERYRDQRSLAFIDSCLRDIQYACRTLAKSPTFSVAAILTLALGIGANTAIFSLLDAVLLRSLPVRDPEQLLQVMKMDGAEARGESYSYPHVRAFAEQTDVFAGVFGFGLSTETTGTPAVPGAFERIGVAWVTGGYYEALGIRGVAGRLLSAGDDGPDASPAGVITDAF